MRRLRALSVVLAALLVAPAIAGSLQVAPILLEFENSQNAQSLWLTNSGSTPLRAQIRVRHWTQADQQDVLEPSDLLLASPPIVEIDAGQQQLIRLVRAHAFTPATESAFRLIIDELPAAPDAPDPGLQFLLRYSIPVFVLPAGTTTQLSGTAKPVPTDASQLSGHWTIEGRTARLVLDNSAPQRIRISQLSWVGSDGQHTLLTPGLLGYVLTGQRMQWMLPLPRTLAGDGMLHAKLNDDSEPQPLPRVITDR